MGSNERGDFVEVEFSLAEPAYPAISLSRQLDCRLDLLDAVQGDDGTTTAFFHVTGWDQATAAEREAAQYEGGLRVLERFDDEALLKVTLERSVFGTFGNLGVPLQSLEVSDGTARFVATVPPTDNPGEAIAGVKARHPSTVLVGKRRRSLAAPFVTQTAFRAIVDRQLTGRQRNALLLAFEYGYFERPRNATQAELAAKMDISPSTFAQHLHAALRKLLDALFAESTHDLPGEDDMD